MRELRERGIGFYSFLYERIYAGAAEPMILRAERLREELRAALARLGELPNACAEQFLDKSPPLNVSRHERRPIILTRRLAKLVAERDRTVIERYRYTL